MGLDNPVHLALLVVALLLIFGAKRLPEIGRSLGSGMREFKQSISGDGASHEQQPVRQQTLPPTQAPAQSASPASAQDAFAQRDAASTEQR